MTLTTSTKISLLNGLILLALSLSEFFGFLHFGLIFSYQWHKLLHLLGVALFMGNMVVGPVWFSYAYYARDKTLLQFASRLLQITDMYLMAPGIALTVLNGLCLASAFGGTAHQPWLFNSMLLLFGMWALSVPVVYLQEKMFAIIDREPENNTKVYAQLIRWSILGTLVTIPPSIIFYLMVFKGA